MDDFPLKPMDDSLRLIQYLYGDTVDDPEFPRRVMDDDELRQEFDRLQETKNALDRRSSRSPDPAVVDRVVRRAAEASRAGQRAGRAPDRAARAPGREWTRRLQGAGAAVVLLLALGLGWWYLPTSSTTAESVVSESTRQPMESSTASSAASGEAEALPEWDDRDEVVRLHRRIERLQTQSRSDAWGGGLQPASQSSP